MRGKKTTECVENMATDSTVLPLPGAVVRYYVSKQFGSSYQNRSAIELLRSEFGVVRHHGRSGRMVRFLRLFDNNPRKF